MKFNTQQRIPQQARIKLTICKIKGRQGLKGSCGAIAKTASAVLSRASPVEVRDLHPLAHFHAKPAADEIASGHVHCRTSPDERQCCVSTQDRAAHNGLTKPMVPPALSKLGQLMHKRVWKIPAMRS